MIVYVDENGNALSSVTSGQIATVAPTTYVATSVYVAPTSTSVYVAPTTTAAAATTTAAASSSKATSKASSATSSAASSSSSSADGPSGYGLVYSPYMDDGNCKTADQVSGDFESISGYSFVRAYGTDCNQVSTILAAAKAKGMKLFLGIYDITAVTSEIQTIISAVGSDWDMVDTISIGNEGVNNGQYTVSAVVAAISTARGLLKSTSFSGNVVTVDTFVATIANPELCEASDYAAVNCHPFFDGGVTADQAGTFVLEQMQRVSSACGGKNTWITETGWPTKGNSNNKAVPGTAEQSTAISAIRSAISKNVILFSAFNDYWKSDNSGTYGCEKYWGMFGSSKYSTTSE